MKQEPLTHKWVYTQNAGEEFSTVPEDVYFEKEGRRYKRFYKGQEIPAEIWKQYFEENQAVERAEIPENREGVTRQLSFGKEGTTPQAEAQEAGEDNPVTTNRFAGISDPAPQRHVEAEAEKVLKPAEAKATGEVKPKVVKPRKVKE